MHNEKLDLSVFDNELSLYIYIFLFPLYFKLVLTYPLSLLDFGFKELKCAL